ncbi:MAG: TonB-dependent receptor, partial [Myxococcota bacterium]
MLLAAVCLLGTASARDPAGPPMAEAPEPRSELSIIVFEAGRPVPGVAVVIEGQLVGMTDDAGSLQGAIPAGRRDLQLFRRDDVLAELDLLTLDGEVVQVIVTVIAQRSPRLDIETSADSPPLASERQTKAIVSPSVDAGPPGALVGRIRSASNGRPVARARLFFTGTEAEARTDHDGTFMIELPSGLYSLSVVHPDFSTQTLDNVRVIAGREVATEIELTPAGIELQEYVVVAPYVEGSIVDTLARQRETSSVAEVLGYEQIAAAGDSDAADALQRASGLTVEQGRFVLVRGQPYRYTFTTWNGSPLPSPEPLLRVVPLDLFPTGVLAGIEVQKSYSADLPAAFGAGLIDLQTRGVPEEGFFDLDVSTNLNSVSAFGNGLTYPGGSLDFFGFDDGTRALPEPIRAANAELGDLRELPQDEQFVLARTFDNVYLPQSRTLPPDFGLSLSGGGSLAVPGNGRLGAVAAVKFSNSWRQQDRIQRKFGLAAARILDNRQPLAIRNDLRQVRTDNNADLGGMLTVQGLWDAVEVSSNTFYAHQTQQRAERTSGESPETDKFVRRFLLSWIERELFAQQLSGSATAGPLRLDARGMLARAARDAPDRRETAWADFLPFEPDDPRWQIDGDSGAKRGFSTVDDRVQSYGLDLTLLASDPEEHWLGLELRAGLAGSRQDRTAVTRTYNFAPRDESCPEDAVADRPCGAPELFDDTDSDALYDPAHIGNGLPIDFNDASRSSKDDYIGSQRVFGVYGLADLRFGDLARVVGGLRYERFEMDVTTFQLEPDEEGAITSSIEHTRGCTGPIRLGRLDDDAERPGAPCALYPSLSSTVFLGKEMQVRTAYGRSTSRPNLNELSDTSFVDPDTGEVFLGSTALRPAIVNGFDARWEWYPSTTESLTFGGFVKTYTNPIERTFLQRGGTNPTATFQNAVSAVVRGLELGGRIEPVENVYLAGNVAL